MNDDRFERSADMRLMDLQRTRLGAPAPRLDWERLGGALPHGGAPPDDAPEARGPLLSAILDAQPRGGLIPGAQVTVSLAIVNDGSAGIAGIRAVLPLPAGLRLVPGSLRIDAADRDDEVAEDLLGGGIALAPIGPGERRTVVARFAVESGLDDVVLLPHVRADDGTGITGPRGLRLTRGAHRPLDVARAPERPFYELDDDEVALEAEPPDEPALAPAPPPSAVVVQPPEHFEPVLPPLPEPEPEPEPEPVAAPAAPLGPQAIANGSFVLEVTLDRPRIASLRALFTGKPLGMLAHYLVLNALATRRPLDGDGDTVALTAFLETQERLLSRALISTRLGKPIAPESVAAPLPAFPPDLPERDGAFALAPAPDGAVTLVRAFRPSEVAFIARTLTNESAHPFLRAAQFFVGLAPGDAAVDDDQARARASATFLSYATQAAASISRIFLRAKLARSVALFRDSDPELDAAGKAALACIDGLIG
jgi:hypothetical protein